MEQKGNTSSASYSDSSFYRNKSSYEENTDDENSEDSESDENADFCDSGTVAGEVHRRCSLGKSSPSPNTSPILSRRKVAPQGYDDQISSPTELQTRGKHAVEHVQHEVNHLSTSELNASISPLMRKPIHSTPLESPRSRSQMTVQRKVQATVTYADVSTELLGANKKSPSSRSEKSRHLTREAAPVISSELLKQLLQENLPVIVLSVVLVVTGLFACYRVRNNPQPENYDDSLLRPNQILEDFLQSFDKLNSSFPAQTSTFWKVLRAGTRSIIVPETPVQPAVFIVAVPKDAQQTALCIVRRYAAIVTKAFKGHQPIEFTHHLRSADTPDNIKHMIDDTLSLGFSKGSRVALIHELNKLHGKSAMMFHGYCDNENAPFTQVVIMFTLFMDAVNEETDVLVEKKLSQVWGKYLDSDQLFPLLSRIGNRNAFVRQETNEVLKTNGCL